MTKWNPYTTYYRQCVVQKPLPNEDKVMFKVCWLPEIYAKMGEFVQLKEENGWEVTFVSENRLTQAAMEENSQDYKLTRKASDI